MQRPTRTLPASILLAGLVVGLPAMGCAELELDDQQLRDGEDLEPMPASKLEGLRLEKVKQFSPFTVTYEMFPYPSINHPFTAPEIADSGVGWPVHALQWKDYASGGGFAFDIAAAYADVDAIWDFGAEVDAIDATRLNTLEANGVVFSADPNGTWMEANFSDPAVGLAYAALVMHFWKSPVYVSAQHFYPPYGTTVSHSIALQRLVFTIVSAPDLLAACGLPANATPVTALSTIPNCNHGAILSADEVSLWNDLIPAIPANPTYIEYDDQVALAPADLIQAWWSGSVQGQLVFDPPADATGEDLAGIAVLAEALRDQLLVEGDGGYLITIDDYVAELEG